MNGTTMMFVLVRYMPGATALASDLVFESREAALAFAAAKGISPETHALGLERWEGFHGSPSPYRRVRDG